ncbi:hypothetical protein A2U01_0060448, partial [Trifolium medium]|nr:hypothetical protein [Trifolium medium]
SEAMPPGSQPLSEQALGVVSL